MFKLIKKIVEFFENLGDPLSVFERIVIGLKPMLREDFISAWISAKRSCGEDPQRWMRLADICRRADAKYRTKGGRKPDLLMFAGKYEQKAKELSENPLDKAVKDFKAQHGKAKRFEEKFYGKGE